LKGTQILKKSKIIETDPVGGPAGQPKFLNAVFKVETNLSPVSLLKKLKEIESELGRPRQHARNAPRTIDLDILFYGNKIINQEELKIPHPKVFEREFVIRPLLEVI
jgi:2-amino-4-hydroxy-6-hydroxymethyldihydropteridine diphosphokinase